MNRVKVYAVILVGGKGKRLRPLSTDSMPKAFLSVTKDKKTMFRRTIDRIKRVIPERDIMVVANRSHSRLVKKDFPSLESKNLIREPQSKNTAPAITIAALCVKKKLSDAIMVVLPTDQYVADEWEYLNSIKSGLNFVKKHNGVLLILAVRPKSPATEFGYLKVPPTPFTLQRAGKGLRHKAKGNIYKVEEFVEKPDVKTARRYLKSGRYLWNAGGFIFRASSLLKAIEKYAPKIFTGLKDSRKIDAAYRKLPNISIDYAVMEKSDNIYCVKGSYGWQDMGSFDALKEILEHEGRAYVSRGEKIIKIL